MLYSAGEVGDSEYGEKADMRWLLFGDGINGDLTAAMIAIARVDGVSRR